MVEASRLMCWWAGGRQDGESVIPGGSDVLPSRFVLWVRRLPLGEGRNPGWRLSPVPFCSASSSDEGS